MPAAVPSAAPAVATLAVDYVAGADPRALLADTDVLAVFGFGDAAPAALDGSTPQALAPELQAYARRLTLAWALLLSALAAFDLAMALLASREQWSWLANIGDYVVIGGFMLLEFAWRRHRFPGRHRRFIDFIRRMVGLGPAFWRGVASP